MSRYRRLSLAVILAGLATSAAAAPAARPDFTGLWALSSGETQLLKDKDVALTPYGRARVDARRQEITEGYVRSESHVRCLPAGMPQMMTAPFGIQIMQAKDRLLIAPEVSTLPRTVYLDAKHPEDLDPSWNGHSIGRWEGQTLVVDTVGFNDRDAFDFNFDPPVKRTPSLHIIERLHLEKGGALLVDEMTLDDPKTFTTPAKVTYRYDRQPADAGLLEYVCEVDVDSIKAFDEQKARRGEPPTPRARER